MRERVLTLPLTILLLCGLALAAVPVVTLAESGLPASIMILPPRAGPGSTVEIVGLDFPTGTSVDLLLTTTAGQLSLGAAETGEGGYFRHEVSFPVDLAPGFWELRATASDGTVAVSIIEGAVQPAPGDPATGSTTAAAAGGGLSITDIIVLVILGLLLVGIIAATVFVWRTTHRKEGGPGMGAGDDPIWSNARGSR